MTDERDQLLLDHLFVQGLAIDLMFGLLHRQSPALAQELLRDMYVSHRQLSGRRAEILDRMASAWEEACQVPPEPADTEPPAA